MYCNLWGIKYKLYFVVKVYSEVKEKDVIEIQENQRRSVRVGGGGVVFLLEIWKNVLEEILFENDVEGQWYFIDGDRRKVFRFWESQKFFYV